MNDKLFAYEMYRIGPFILTDSLITSVLISCTLVITGALLMRIEHVRSLLEIAYTGLERAVQQLASVDVQGLLPLVLTLWLFLGVANLVGLIPTLLTPTRDLSITSALAAIAFSAGHVHAFRIRGAAYLRTYLDPHPLLLPFNLIGEITRTIALALRLFGNMLSGHLVLAILVYLAGLLVPVPLMLLSVITGVVQAYIFGVLTLVFAVSSLEVAEKPRARKKGSR